MELKPKPGLIILEDHYDSRQAMKSIAEKRGYEVTAVGSVREAIALLEGKVKAILDLRLPDGNGLEVLREIRAHHKSISVAVVSGEFSIDMSEIARLGPELCLRKPVDFDTFVAWLDSA